MKIPDPSSSFRRLRALRLALSAGAAVLAALIAHTASAPAAPVMGGSDPLRTGWYPDQAALSPQLVSGGTFGKLWTTQVTGQVLAQPLVYGGTVLVVTEANWIYGITPATGAVVWSRNVGVPFGYLDTGPDVPTPGVTYCPDLTPLIGITGTPVIDDTTGTAYFVAKTYANGGNALPAAIFMHAIDVATGAERANFPVEIKGTAQNAPGQTFAPRHQMQRPGLLLTGGVVYAGFGAHCDFLPFQGWIVGVSTAGAISTMWTDRSGSGTSGNGIWMGGSGLVSDRAGSMIFSTGNAFGGASPSGAIPGNLPPADLGESIVRVNVQTDGALKAVDFFTPTNAAALDNADADVGSGGPVALPSAYFGTAAYPNLMVHASKDGYVNIFNRDSLGGVGQGPGGGDALVAHLGPYGYGVFGRAGVWPGDGGWVYFPVSGKLSPCQYGLTGAGKPTLSFSNTAFAYQGYTSGSPVITSNGTQTGSALVWQIWIPSPTGVGAQLRAFDPMPVNGELVQRFVAPVGTGSKFSVPGVSGGRLFVGTRDGTVLGFGAPITTTLSGGPVNFPDTVVNQTSTVLETFTASAAVTVTGLNTSSALYTLGAPTPALPAALVAGGKLTVPVTFTPVAEVLSAAALNVTNSGGLLQVGLAGRGIAAGPVLAVVPLAVDFGTIAVGSQVSSNVTLRNLGGTAVVISSATGPGAPYSSTGLPAAGAQIPVGGSLGVSITFGPTEVGEFDDGLHLRSNGGDFDVPITAHAAAPGLLVVSPLTLDFGTVDVGSSKTFSFTAANTGGTDITILRSKPGTGGWFLRGAELYEGAPLAAGASVVIPIEFAPMGAGPQSAYWTLNSNGLGGLQSLTFTGIGRDAGLAAIPDPAAGGWQANGVAHVLGPLRGSPLQLTPEGLAQAGSAFWPAAIGSANLDITFLATLGSGTGGDGLALVLADPSKAQATALGAAGAGLGFAGIGGLAVALDTVQTATNPSANFVGITDGFGAGAATLRWLATSTAVPALRGTARLVHVRESGGTLLVWLDGVLAISQPVTLPPAVLVGFSASTGTLSDNHAVSNVYITSGVREVEPVVTLTPRDGAPLSGAAAIHADATPVSGGSIAGLTLRLDGAVLARSTNSRADALWDTTLASNGQHTLDAAATAGNGSVGTATAQVQVVNGPRVALVAPVDGAQVSGLVAVSARGSPPLGTTLSSLALLIDGAQVSQGVASPLAWSWDTRALPNGSKHALSVAGLDADQTSAASYAAVVTVRNPPVVTLTTPAAFARVSGAVAVTAAASAPPGTTVATTALTADGVVFATVNGAGAAGVWQTAGLSNGPHVLGAVATDADQGAAAAAPLSITIANPPAVMLSVADGATVAGTVDFQATSTAPPGTTVASTTLTVGALAPVKADLPRATLSVDTTALANGTSLAIFGAALDADSTTSTARATVTVRNPPVAQITSLTSGAVVSGVVPVTVGGAPAKGGVLATVSLAIDGAQVASGTAPLTYRWDTTPLLRGSVHAVVATATADDGLSAPAAPVGVIIADPDAGHAPGVAILAPADGAQVGGTTRVTVIAAAPSTTTLRSVTLRLDGAQVATFATSPLTWSWDTSTAVNGPHLLQASAAGADGATAESPLASVTVSNDFSLILSPAVRVLTVGGAAWPVAVFASASGATQPITLGLSGLPPGIKFAFAPPTLTGEGVSTLTLTAPAGIAPAPETPAFVTGTSVGLPGGRTARLLVSAVAPPRVAITPPASSLVSGPVSLSASATSDAKAPLVSLELFDGVTRIAGSAASPLSALWDTRLVPNGVHTLVAVAQDALGNTAQSSLTLTTLNDFSVAVSPGSAALISGGAAANLLVTTTVTGGAEPLALAASGLPDGVKATFTPNPVIAGKSATLALQADASAASLTGAVFQVVATSASVPAPGHAASATIDIARRGSSGGCASAVAAWSALLGLLALGRARRTSNRGT